MSERKMRHVVMVIFAFLAVLLFFAPAWSAAGAAEEGPSVAGSMFARVPFGGGRIFLPLRKTDVRIDVTAGVVSAEVRQSFRNDTAYLLEAVYVFPLPSRASVTGMELHLRDRVVRSVVKERQEAKKRYERAKREGRKAALLEEERPNIFTTSVANFGPGESVEVRLTYSEPAEYRRGAYSVTFPMVVGQRYIPARPEKMPDGGVTVAPAVADAARINPPLLPPSVDSGHRLSLSAEISGLPVREVVSHTHAIEVRRPDGAAGAAVVTLAREEAAPDRDFNILIYLEESADPGFSVVRSAVKGSAYDLVTIFPPTEGGEASPPSPREVIYVVDTSGSMAGDSIGQAKAGLRRCLDMLRPADSFTIVRFSGGHSSFSPDLRAATAGNLEAARGFVDGLSAGGGTEMQGALEYVLGLPRKGGLATRIVVLLTDGNVGNEETLRRLLAERLDGERIFAFAIGSAPNEHLVRKMAEAGRGQALFIRSHEDIGEVMADFFRTLDSPALADISLSWVDGRSGSELEVERYPVTCPDVYRDRPVQVAARPPAGFSGSLVITGRLGGETVRYEFPVETGPTGHHDAIGKIFGRAAIEDLMYRMIRARTEEDRRDLRRRVVDVALEHQLLSKFTSRVAVEEKVQRRDAGLPVTVPVAVPLPAGWDPAHFFPTATTDAGRLLGGAAMMAGAIVMALLGRAGAARVRRASR